MSFGNRDMYMEDATRERRETIKREQGKVLTAQAITEEEAMDDDEETLAATGSEENPVSCMPIMHITPDILDGIPVGPDGRFALYKALDKLTERKPGYPLHPNLFRSGRVLEEPTPPSCFSKWSP